MIMIPETLKPRVLNLHGLSGISDRPLNMHMVLWEGYVSATNALNEYLFDLRKDGKLDHEGMPAYSELARRLGSVQSEPGGPPSFQPLDESS
jgi:hypothetical protein